MGWGFDIQNLGFGIWDLQVYTFLELRGNCVWGGVGGPGFRFWALGFGLCALGFGVWVFGLRVFEFWFLGFGFRGWVLGLGVLSC